MNMASDEREAAFYATLMPMLKKVKLCNVEVEIFSPLITIKLNLITCLLFQFLEGKGLERLLPTCSAIPYSSWTDDDKVPSIILLL